MTIERNFIFANGNAYDIERTIQEVQLIFDTVEDGVFPTYRLETIIATLMDFKFLICVDLDDYIPDPFTGIELPMDIWLVHHGVVDHRIDYYLAEVGSWSADDTSLSELDGEECITAEEEDMLTTGVAILAELNAETQAVDGLYILGHTEGNIFDQFDSFCDDMSDDDSENYGFEI